MWSSIEEMIEFYSELSPEERLRVEQHVQQHPELVPLLDEAKAFTALLGQARLLQADPPSDEALAYYVATRHVSPHPLSAPFDEAFARLESRLTDDASLRARYAEQVRRMAVLEANTDPVRQFEQLSGHSLGPPLSDRPAPDAEAPTEAFAAPEAAPAAPAIHRLWRQVGRWAVAAVFLVVALYGSLGAVSHFSQSDLDRLAALPPAALQAQNLQMRSGEPVPDYVSSDELHERALSLLQEARTHTLGLFPRYDQATLNEAAGLLQRVVDQEEANSPLRSEAYFLMAKIRLARKNVDGAKVALHAVIEGSGWKASEAQALLDDLEKLSN